MLLVYFDILIVSEVICLLSLHISNEEIHISRV